MDIMQTVLKLVGSSVIDNVTKEFNVDGAKTEAVLSSFSKVLMSKIGSESAGMGGLAGIMQMASQWSPEKFLEKPEDITSADSVAQGNDILSKFFGSKDESVVVAEEVAKDTGVDSGTLMKMLPIVAVIAVAAIKKFSSSMNAADGDGGIASMLTGMLDADKDGQVVDDLAGMAKKFLS